MKKVITISIVIIVILFIFFIKNNYKILNFGNNITNKSADKIKKYILDISSYETNATITVISNKNTNTYTIMEKYMKQNNIRRTEIIEPQNLNGMLIIYDGTNLKIENNKKNLNLCKIYANYKYIGENDFTLISFINDYNNFQETKMIEKDDEIILETKAKNGNKYHSYKKLYINRKTGNPTKLEVQDITQKTTINILYNEIKINNLQEDDILAFKTEILKNDI